MVNTELNVDIEIKVESETIQQVDYYIYLGQHISASTSKEEEINHRITLVPFFQVQHWNDFEKLSL